MKRQVSLEHDPIKTEFQIADGAFLADAGQVDSANRRGGSEVEVDSSQFAVLIGFYGRT